MAEKKLKPCPFCGCREIITQNPYDEWVVYCAECGSSTAYFDFRVDAEKAWNRRAE